MRQKVALSMISQTLNPPRGILLRFLIGQGTHRSRALAILPDCHTSPVFAPSFFFFNDTPTPEIYTLPLHDPLPIFFLKIRWSAPIFHFEPRFFPQCCIPIRACDPHSSLHK